ncbi:MAG TPA: zinc-binding alcohol dehydrogenase family protein [Steroidobacteraceae bacterium]|nr:zinc-binding alcohol dehydrogenase family protein [Steroidobacteraceae bacterium]
MKAVICESPGTLFIAERPLPARGAGEVLLRVRRVGVCGTDMHIVRGTQPYLSYPRVMGHELGCEVVEAPAGSELKSGDAAFVMPYLSCGRCNACARGKTNCCMRLEVLGVHRDGGMAEFITVPAQFVIRADGLTLDQVSMVEFLSIGAHAVERPSVQPGEQVLVVGAGPIGVAVQLFAGLAGARVTALDTRADRLELAKRLGRAGSFVTFDTDTRARLLEITRDQMFDVVFDCTGNVRAMEAGFDYVAHGGRYVLVSIVPDRVSFSDPEFHRRETTLLGSRNATLADVTRVMDAIRSERIDTRVLNTHRAPLTSVPEAMFQWMKPETGVMKAIVEC